MDKINNIDIVSDRIDLVKLFQQEINPIEIGKDIAKLVFGMEDACRNLELHEDINNSNIDHKPKIKIPERKLSSNINFISSLSSLRKILNESNISHIQSQLYRIKAESESLNQQGTYLLNEFEYCTQKLQNKEQDIKLIRDEYTNNQKKLLLMNNELNNIKEQLAFNSINLTEENKSFFLSEQMRLTSDINMLNDDLAYTESKLESAYNNVASLAIEADDARIKLNLFIENAPLSVEIDGPKWENTLALLTMLTAQLKKMMNEDSLRSLKEQESVMEQISTASRKDSENKAQEAEEAQRKAEDASKSASCASKTLSYVLLAVSVVATVASFGSAAPLTIAIAALGIAMSVTDIVLEETGQGSLMQKMAGVISHVMTDVLICFGVEAEQAKQIANILGIVIAAAAFLAIGFLSSSSLFKNMQSTVTNMAKTISNHTKNIIQGAIKVLPKALIVGVVKLLAKKSPDLAKLSKLLEGANKSQKTTQFIEKSTKALKSQKTLASHIEVGAKATGIAVSVVSSATSGGFRLYAGAKNQDLKTALANMTLNSDTIKALDELLETLIKTLSDKFEQMNDIFTGMLLSLKQTDQQKTNSINLGKFA
ncbi:type III secretion system translocon subunit SctE [Providencia sneebia]|uniref:Putative type III secretion system effector protein n=1 Tax=Providencia sneebia DSM 19967 TaxID=1141660 RepID=K8WXI4_9GAMM|nr:type III secretion system translocon subunit SctE [Providencia sneebia]EKT60900.1 putative type III secretion system effector protein [Providencia sneebia DSM 19967]